MVLSLFVVVLLLLIVVLVALDFLLPFYKHFLFIQYSRLSNVLTASTTPIPNQKLIISSAVKAAVRPSYLLEVNEFLFVSADKAPLGGRGVLRAFFSTCSMCSSIFITLGQIMSARNYSNA